MTKSSLSRRDFLKLTRNALLTLSGLLGLSGVVRFMSFQTEPPPPTEFDLGPASNYPTGSRTVLPDVPAILIHDEQDFIALSLVCTHLGCTLESKKDGFSCPCHGSRFDTQGKMTRGPARKPLPGLRVVTNPDGSLHLFTN